MAAIFYAAITKAYNAGKIQAASTPDLIGPSSCAKVYGDGHYAGAMTQTESGQDDDIYLHSTVGMGTLLTVIDEYDRDQWFFARLCKSCTGFQLCIMCHEITNIQVRKEGRLI